MLSGANRWLVLACILVMGIAAALFWWKRNSVAEIAESENCAVYRSMYRELANGSYTPIFNTRMRALHAKSWGRSPTEAWNNRGEFTYISQIRYKRDATAGNIRDINMPKRFIQQTVADDFSLSDCFVNSSGKPVFIRKERFFSWLSVYRSRLFRGQFGPVWDVHTVSPVGFSEDGQYALVYVEDQCVRPCGFGGFGAFFVSQKHESGWIVIGTVGFWVS